VNIPDDDDVRLEQALFDELFGWKVALEDVQRVLNKMPLKDVHRRNQAMLPLTGIGEDSFYLREWFGEDRTILDFATLRDYDEDDHAFQEAARVRDFKGYQPKPYRGALYLASARLFVDDAFVYAGLSMAAGYLFSRLQDDGWKIVGELLPHKLVPGPDHGEEKKEGYHLWDMQIDAGGKEDLYYGLIHRANAYVSERYDALLTAWRDMGRGGVYLLDDWMDEDDTRHFVFSDPDALSKVRFRSFVGDCRAIERPAEELGAALAEEQEALRIFVSSQYEELLRSPVKPRERRKIVMHRDVFEAFGQEEPSI
jgi:hypothetical protein